MPTDDDDLQLPIGAPLPASDLTRPAKVSPDRLEQDVEPPGGFDATGPEPEDAP